MNKITEEAMTNMIRRIEKLENSVYSWQKKKNHSVNSGGNVSECASMNPSANNPNIASKAQTDYLRSLGGKVWSGMSKEEAGKGIDERTGKNKDKKMSRDVPQCPTMSREIVEPKEVETDDAGLDGDLL